MIDRHCPLPAPSTDPTAIFELYRGNYGTELLVAAITHFDIFGRLAQSPRSLDQLRDDLGLQPRPALVLITALRAMGLLSMSGDGRLAPTRVAQEHLIPGSDFDVSDYLGLAASSPGVLAMTERLRTNRPAGLDEQSAGAAFIYRAGLASAMEQQELARHFTLSLAGRAKNVAPILADRVSLAGARTLLDVGGGTGIYSIAYLRRHPQLTAIVLDRPEVLKIAGQFAEQYGVQDRLELLAGDMFDDPLPRADAILLSNILHDWDVPECCQLIRRCVAALNSDGRLLVHDVLLSDALDGPLPVALYSAALFVLTEGRAYSGAEYVRWLTDAGLRVKPAVPTLIHCHLVEAQR